MRKGLFGDPTSFLHIMSENILQLSFDEDLAVD